jgi:hypothetical protein
MIEGTCIHYKGGPQAVCAAGVNIREHVGGPDFGWGCRMPCHKRSFSGVDVSEKVPCALYLEPTAEQIAAHEEKFMKLTERSVIAVDAIRKDAAGKRGVVGKVECPACKGILRYGVALNNHIKAICSTEGCINFIQ